MKKIHELLMLVALVAVAGCGRTETHGKAGATAATADSLQALAVAVLPTIDCLPLFVAEAEGWLQQDGASMALVPFAAQMDADTALLGGSVHCLFTDLVRAERLQQQGTPLSYLSATELHWQLLTNRTARIRQLKQLDDKMLAMTRFSATALLADAAVDSARLKPERVFRIQVNDVGIRLSMLENNIMDAVLLPEPQATQARNQRAALLTDTRSRDVRLGVLAGSRSALADTLRQRQSVLLTQLYNRACDSINQNGLQHYARLIAVRCGVKPQTTDSLPADIRFTHAAAPRQQDIDLARAWLKKN